MTKPSRRFALSLLTVGLSAAAASAQCGIVADLTPGNANNNNIGSIVAAFDEQIYFSYYHATYGSELWRWDHVNGAQMVVDYAPGTYNHSPEQITPCCTAAGPRVFYSGFEIGHGHELFVTDGTAAGTARVKEIRSGSSSALPSNMIAVGQRLFFSASDGVHGREPWISDGTAAGTMLLANIRTGGSSNPQYPFIFGDKVLFVAQATTTGRELYITDGTPAGTQLLKDINPGAGSSSPVQFTRMGNHVYFVADDGSIGSEIWKTDGTPAGTVPMGDLFPGSSHGPYGLCACDDKLFFFEWHGSNSGPVFVSDGTLAGTVDLSAATGVFGRSLTPANGRVFFAGDDLIHGQEPWVTDGTVAGTQLIADLRAGSSNPSQLVPTGNGICFVARTTLSGEIWHSDGTLAGTNLLCNLDPSGNANPMFLTMCRGQVFMNAYSTGYGRELHAITTPGATVVELPGASGPGQPRLRTRNCGAPVLGSTVDLEAIGPAGSLTFLLADIAGLPAPIAPIPGVVEGGYDYVGLQAGTAIPISSALGATLTLPFALPSSTTFEGVIFDFQAIWFDPAATPALQASNGLRLVLGPASAH